MAHMMLNAKKMSQTQRVEATNTACYMIDCVHVHPKLEKTLYELLGGKKPNVRYFHAFGSWSFILKNREAFGKFELKSDEDIVLGYSTNGHAYRVYNS